jgi:hypothetical protein
VPWIAASAISVLGVNATTPIDWVPATFPARRAYAEFTAEFESGDVAIASWPGCTLDAASIGRFLEAATGSKAPRDAAGRLWFEDLTSGRQAVERLTDPPLSLDREIAIKRLERVLIGGDGERTCVVVGFTAAGRADRRRAVQWIRDTLRDTAGVSDAELHLAGPVVEAGVEGIFLAGPEMQRLAEALPPGLPQASAPSADDLWNQLHKALKDSDLLLIKGSNASGMGRLADRLRQWSAEAVLGKMDGGPERPAGKS